MTSHNEVVVIQLAATSVTRFLNKSSQLYTKLPKKCTAVFSLKVLSFKTAKKSPNICATFVTNLLRRSFKNRPICSHWSPVTYRASFVWLLQRFEMTSLVSFKLRPAPFKVTKIDSMKWLVWFSYFVKNGPSPSASFSLFSFFKQFKVNI